MEFRLIAEQSQKLTPQLVHNIRVLSMTTQELLEYIRIQLEENPFLEEIEETPSGCEEEKLWVESFDATKFVFPERTDADGKNDTDGHGGRIYDNTTQSLYEHICAQISFLNADARAKAAAKYVARGLDDNGYLAPDFSECTEYFTKEELEEAASLIKTLDPPGVGAKDPKECLLLQLHHMEECETAERIVSGCLEDLGRSDYKTIAKSLNLPIEEVYEACRLIRSLQPKPGTMFNSSGDPVYIMPDVMVSKRDGYFEVSLNDRLIPKIRINSYYSNLLSSTTDKEVKEYLREKQSNAAKMISALEARRAGLVSLTNCLIKLQPYFFSSREGRLLPLTQQKVAEIMDTNESTVSRLSKGKYIQTERGVLPFRAFFSRSASEADRVYTVNDAKEEICRLINNEDKENPLSDQKLMDILGGMGYQLARRTVAKYRDELGIAKASVRKANALAKKSGDPVCPPHR